VLVGNSLGGYAALAAGAALSPAPTNAQASASLTGSLSARPSASTPSAEPSLAAGVVLLNAAGPFSSEQAEPRGWGAIAQRTVGRAILCSPVVQRLLFENLRRPATVRRTLERVYIDRTNVDDALVDSILRPARDPGAFGVFRTVFDIPRGEPLDALFARLGVPLLLLWGLRDPWINAEGRRATFARHAPPRTTEVLLDAGHCPHDEVPEQVNAALLEWLLTLTPATASLP
jgi:pimeloyl-ACP methyl ester carboxylesterase